VTNPDLANVLRNMKVPELLPASQALRAYLLAPNRGRTRYADRRGTTSR
jgi:hypothetical protein